MRVILISNKLLLSCENIMTGFGMLFLFYLDQKTLYFSFGKCHNLMDYETSLSLIILYKLKTVTFIILKVRIFSCLTPRCVYADKECYRLVVNAVDRKGGRVQSDISGGQEPLLVPIGRRNPCYASVYER